MAHKGSCRVPLEDISWPCRQLAHRCRRGPVTILSTEQCSQAVPHRGWRQNDRVASATTTPPGHLAFRIAACPRTMSGRQSGMPVSNRPCLRCWTWQLLRSGNGLAFGFPSHEEVVSSTSPILGHYNHSRGRFPMIPLGAALVPGLYRAVLRSPREVHHECEPKEIPERSRPGSRRGGSCRLHHHPGGTHLRAQETSLPEPLCQRYCQGRKGSTQLANSLPNHRELNS